VKRRLARWLRVGLRVVLHVLCLPFAPSAPRVLLWHSIDRSGSLISVSPELFARQIAWLVRKGYVTWPVSRYVEALATRRRLPSRLVVLTFDDGYANVLAAGAPILREYGLCATVFLVTGAAGRRPHWSMQATTVRAQPILTWCEVREAVGCGFEIESHTHSHLSLVGEPDDRVRTELSSSRVELGTRGLGGGQSIAWPYGAYEARLGTLAFGEGYAVGFLDEFYWSGRRNPDLLRLNRIPVNSEFGVLGIAFSLGKGVEVWSWFRERLGVLSPPDGVPARSGTRGSAAAPPR